MMRWFRRHRGWSALLAFGFLFLVAFFVYRTLFAAGTVQGVQYVTQAAENGTLIVSVSGTGNAALGSSYDVTPVASGIVRGLNVKVGDTVTEGQVLFTLENEELDMSIISAQASYDQARASVLNAEANVYQSEQSLDQLEDAADSGSSSASTTTSTTRPPATHPSTTSTTFPPTSTTSTSSPPSTVPPTTTTVPPTTTTVPPTTTTELPTTETTDTSPPTTDVSAYEAAVLLSALGTAVAAASNVDGAAATNTANNAVNLVAALSAPATADTNASGGANTVQAASAVTSTDITVAEKKLAAAEASLAAAQGGLQTAKYNLERAQADAAARTVTAPADGVITDLNILEGASLGSTTGGTTGGNQGATGVAASVTGSSSGAALTIVDPRSIGVLVQLTESDIPQIEVGQKATLTFDAFPDLTLTGKVSAMDLIGTNNQGVVTFSVTVAPDAPDDRVRAGMTGYASIVTAVRQDVLLVPTGALKTADGGGSYVEVLVDGAPERRTVTAGLSGDTQVEIQSGLQTGDEVVTQTIDPNATQTQTGTGGFGIGGGFPGAGGPGR